jgi:hypothetical protein
MIHVTTAPALVGVVVVGVVAATAQATQIVKNLFQLCFC